MKTYSAIHKLFVIITSLALSAVLGCGGEVFKNLLGGEISRIDITPSSASIAKGTNQQLKAYAIFKDGTRSEITNESTWSVDDEFLADITATGEVLSSWAGTVKATANYKGKTATATITITSAELVSLQVTPLTRSMPGGTTYQFSAIGVFIPRINWFSAIMC
ncbi:MAG: Ig-like domain-containing protein [Spirochaetes bacterium]|nr:Ig-like domain-containing protein [Spirochaetota bacterium]